MINAYEGLVQYKNNTDQVEIAPRLAESWEVNPDHDRVHVPPAQGREVPRRHAVHRPPPSTSRSSAASRSRAVRRIWSRRSRASRRPTTYTAVITLNAAELGVPDYLASPFGPKMESPDGLKANAGSDDAQTYLSTHDLGTGPYELTTAQTGAKYELTQFDGYWGPKSRSTRSTCRSTPTPRRWSWHSTPATSTRSSRRCPHRAWTSTQTRTVVSNYFLPTLQARS